MSSAFAPIPAKVTTTPSVPSGSGIITHCNEVSWSFDWLHTMRLDDRPVLPHEPSGAGQRAARGFPWGMLSLTFGVCAVVGMPTFDSVIKVPGYLQSPILITGGAAS